MDYQRDFVRPITDLRRDKKLMGNPRIQCTIDYYLHTIIYDNRSLKRVI